MANELYAIEKGTDQVLEWANVTGIAYSDEVIYEGETFRHDFSISNATAGTAYLYKDTPPVTKVSPDSVLGIAPRQKSVKRSMVTITVTGGETFQVDRHKIRAGALFNIDPSNIVASGTTYYGRLKNGDIVGFGAVTGVAESDEEVYDGETYTNDFDLTRAAAAHGDLEDSAGADAVPDSISKTAPGYKKKTRSIFTVTVTHNSGSIGIRVFRDELAAMALMNANPDA